MGRFAERVKETAKGVKGLLQKGAKTVGDYSKKGWAKVKNLRK